MNRGRPFPRFSRWIPYLVLALALATTAIGWYFASRITYESDSLAFKSVTFDAENDIDDRLKAIINPAAAVAAYVGTVQELTREEFDEFLQRRGWPGNDAGSTIGFSARVPVAKLGDLKRFANEAGDAEFSPRVLPGVPFVDAVMFSDPHRNYSGPSGLNMYSLPDRREAMDGAMLSGQQEMTGLIHFLRGSQEPGVLVFIPIYRTGTVPATEAGRKRQFVGFAFSAIRVREAVQDYIRLQGGQCTISIYDGGSPNPERLLFSNDPATKTWRYETGRSYTELGRSWYIEYHSSPVFERTRFQPFLALVPIGGCCVSILLFLVVSTIQRARLEAEQFALEANHRAMGQSIQARISSALASTFDWRHGLSEVAELFVPAFGDVCAIDLLRDDGSLERIAAAHEDPQFKEELMMAESRYPMDMEAETGIPPVIRTGKARVYRDITPEWLRTGNEADERKELNVRMGVTSAVVAPIRARGKSFGALTVAGVHDRHTFSDDDTHLVEEIAARIGLAIENSRLFESAQREIVERAKAEEQVRHLNEDLETLVDERTRELKTAVEELEAFCYSVSHDLRAPLRSVDGFCKALMEDYGSRLDEDGIGYLHRVRNASRRMDELISALLTLSRVTRAEINPQTVDLSAIAAGLRDDYDPSHTSELTIDPDMTVSGDPRMMRSLLDNLIGNAYKFSGNVEHPSIAFGHNDGTFFVKDNGAGFNPNYAGKLFQPFERLHTDREFPGTGIGLATAARIVRRHGGTIWAESEPGKGATFYFTIGAN